MERDRSLTIVAREGSAGGKRQPAAAGQIAAQQVEGLGLGVFRNEALRGERHAEMHDVTRHQQQGPHIDIRAELIAAHPAREQNL